jgi:exodeoxyribonuclease VII large subunit
VQEAAARLQALSPLATLARGYAVARDDSGAALISAAQFKAGAPFRLVLRDGQVRATVRDVTLGPPAGGAEGPT